MAGKLLVEDRGSITVLSISNPGKRNALDAAICDGLVAAVGALAGKGARAAVLRGDPAGRAFCAGFDLEALGTVDPEEGERVFERLLAAIAATPVPLVAAISGQAMGGGCELAASCDLRVAGTGARLGLPPARLGIVYPTRGLARFSALCGEGRARQLFLWARTVAADEAHGWGLVDVVAADGDVDARALAMAGEIAELAPLAVQGMRLAFEALLRRRSLLEGADADEISRLRRAAWRSADAAEALAAIAARRKPSFEGV